MADFSYIPENSDLIDDNFVQGAKPVLERLDKVITIKCILKEDEKASTEMGSFLKAFQTLTDKVKAEFFAVGENTQLESELKNDGLTPASGIFDENGNYTGMSFLGVPGGKEMNSFLLAVYNVAGPKQTITERQRERIEGLSSDKDIEIMVSLGCHHCADTVQSSMRIASSNEKVRARMTDANLYPELVEKYKIERVPVIFINGEQAAMGGKNLDDMLTLLEK